MKREEINLQRFQIIQKSREIRNTMIKNLEKAETPQEVRRTLEDTNRQLQSVTRDHYTLKKQGKLPNRAIEEQEDLLGFAHLLKESFEQATKFQGKKQNPVNYHVYH